MISVVTVHGLWMRGAAMRVLRGRLAPRGFQVHEFTYPSITSSLSDSAAALRFRKAGPMTGCAEARRAMCAMLPSIIVT